MPSVLLLEHYTISYNDICKDLGLITKYNYSNTELKKVKLIDKIIIDSREQQPLKFEPTIKTEVLCLKVGDYCKIQDVSNQIVVEKKSLSDLLGTISKGFERFHRELNRAEEKNTKVLVVVDTKFSSVLSFNYLPHIHSKCSPEFIFSRIRELIQNYPNIQFIFCDGRKQASDITHFALSYGKDLMEWDLQYLMEKGLI